MHSSKILTIIFILSALMSFSQNSEKKETIVKKIEGAELSYSEIDGGTDYVFSVNNTSGNTVQFVWDVKVFFTENDSKELHKSIIVEPQEKQKIYILRDLTETKVQSIEAINTKKINRIEVHNLKFKGLR